MAQKWLQYSVTWLYNSLIYTHVYIMCRQYTTRTVYPHSHRLYHWTETGLRILNYLPQALWSEIHVRLQWFMCWNPKYPDDSWIVLIFFYAIWPLVCSRSASITAYRFLIWFYSLIRCSEHFRHSHHCNSRALYKGWGLAVHLYRKWTCTVLLWEVVKVM